MRAKLLASAPLVLLAIGLATLGGPSSRNASAGQGGRGNVGRFQISAYFSSSNAVSGCYVVVTTTGELWQTDASEDPSGLRKWNKVADRVPVSR
jgi:hypothetical protein